MWQARSVRPAIVGVALGLSLLLHAFWVWRLSRGALETVRQRSDERPIELTLVELPRPTAVPLAPRRPVSAAAFEPKATQRAPHLRIEAKQAPLADLASEQDGATQPSGLTAVPADPEARSERAGEGTAATEAARAPAAALNGLSPAAAASTLADELFAAPRANACRSAFSGEAPRCDDAVPSPAQRLQQSLDDAATRIPHLAQRPPPALKRDANGDYHYDGKVFTALIRRDGSVAFSDRAVVQAAPIPIAGSFDLTDAVEKHVLGKELYPAEKRWFLHHTAELRRTLSDDAQAARLAQGSLHLRGRLHAIVDDRRLSDASKRERVFELWDDCAPDGIGERAQEIVEQFIRDRMPPGSSLAYDSAELARFNRGRASLRAFDPYTHADAGAPG
jgi:hypothetical protein